MLNPRRSTRSLAIGQVSLSKSRSRYPLWPPRLHGSDDTGADAVPYPVEVDYDYARFRPEIIDAPAVPPFDHWAALKPGRPLPSSR